MGLAGEFQKQSPPAVGRQGLGVRPPGGGGRASGTRLFQSCTCTQRVGRGMSGHAGIFRELAFLLLRPLTSQAPRKGLDAACAT